MSYASCRTFASTTSISDLSELQLLSSGSAHALVVFVFVGGEGLRAPVPFLLWARVELLGIPWHSSDVAFFLRSLFSSILLGPESSLLNPEFSPFILQPTLSSVMFQSSKLISSAFFSAPMVLDDLVCMLDSNQSLHFHLFRGNESTSGMPPISTWIYVSPNLIASVIGVVLAPDILPFWKQVPVALCHESLLVDCPKRGHCHSCLLHCDSTVTCS
jgi:hypothetical protein